MLCLHLQCGRVSNVTLTLTRFILETSLMDYSYVSCLESKMAAACLLLAMNMNCDGEWVSVHQYFIFMAVYSSYLLVLCKTALRT